MSDGIRCYKYDNMSLNKHVPMCVCLVPLNCGEKSQRERERDRKTWRSENGCLDVLRDILLSLDCYPEPLHNRKRAPRKTEQSANAMFKPNECGNGDCIWSSCYWAWWMGSPLSRGHYSVKLQGASLCGFCLFMVVKSMLINAGRAKGLRRLRFWRWVFF